MTDLDDDLRDALRELAGEVEPSSRAPRPMLRRARCRRLRTVVVGVVTAGLVTYGGFAGADLLRGLGPHPAPSPAGQSPTPFPTPTPGASASTPSLIQPSLPEAVRLVRTYPGPSITSAASGGNFFTYKLNQAETAVVVSRVGQDGSIVSRSISDPLASYFFSMAADANAVYLSTRVIQRLTAANDEVIRLDAATLSVVTRTTMPQEIIALVADGSNLWVELDTEILRLDPSTLATLATYSMPGATPPPRGGSAFSSLALGPGGLWATFGNALDTTLYRFDPQSMNVRSQAAVPGGGQGISVTANGESVWVAGPDFAQRVEPSGKLSPGRTLGPGLQTVIAQGNGLVAVLNLGLGQAALLQVDARGVVIARSEIGDAGGALVLDGAHIWAQRGLRIAQWVLLHPNP
jgi:hypothetical protein